VNVFETSPGKKRKLYRGFAAVLAIAGITIFILAEGAGLFRLSGTALIWASATLYRRTLSGVARDPTPKLPHVRVVKIFALASLLAACAAFIFAVRSTATWPINLSAGMGILCCLCWAYVKTAKAR
jgi:hypothetical protein